jgi:hypothetical protein
VGSKREVYREEKEEGLPYSENWRMPIADIV